MRVTERVYKGRFMWERVDQQGANYKYLLTDTKTNRFYHCRTVADIHEEIRNIKTEEG